MEQKKSYKADLEHRRTRVFAIALVAVTAVFVGILFIPFKSLSDIGEDFLDDYFMDLDLKANSQDDMVAAALPQQQEEKEEPTRLNKVDEVQELMPEQLDAQQQTDDADIENDSEEAVDDAPINLNGDDDEVRLIVEQLPEYPGGMVEFMKWLTSTLKYPDAALKRKQQGMVRVSFIVEKDGTLTGLKIVKSAGKLFDDEVLRVARLMPQWKPGMEDGKPCRTMIEIPVLFEI